MGIKKTLASLVLAGVMGLGLGAKASQIYEDNFEQHPTGTILNYDNWNTWSQASEVPGWKIYDNTLPWGNHFPTQFASFYGNPNAMQNNNYLIFNISPLQNTNFSTLDFDYGLQHDAHLYVYANGNQIAQFSDTHSDHPHFHYETITPINRVEFRAVSLDQRSGGDDYLSEIDNFRLKLIPEPATAGLIGLGFVGLLASRRRKSE